MKKLLIAILTIALPSFAFAASPGTPAKAFLESAEVKALVDQVDLGDFEIAEQPDVALLGGSCGFAGCKASYLVTLAVNSKGPNTQTRVIAAVVIEQLRTYSVRIVSVKSLEEK